jgi:hypothetical protein
VLTECFKDESNAFLIASPNQSCSAPFFPGRYQTIYHLHTCINNTSLFHYEGVSCQNQYTLLLVHFHGLYISLLTIKSQHPNHTAHLDWNRLILILHIYILWKRLTVIFIKLFFMFFHLFEMHIKLFLID